MVCVASCEELVSLVFRKTIWNCGIKARLAIPLRWNPWQLVSLVPTRLGKTQPLWLKSSLSCGHSSQGLFVPGFTHTSLDPSLQSVWISWPHILPSRFNATVCFTLIGYCKWERPRGVSYQSDQSVAFARMNVSHRDFSDLESLVPSNMVCA